MTVDESGVDISPAKDRGLLKRITREGEGTDTPNAGCLVRVHYTAHIPGRDVVDSSRDRNEPFEFTLGKQSVIKAWDIGVATMKKGEVCVLTCAPEYAYGAAGSPPKIPPNATVEFEIEMIDWQVEDLSPNKNKAILRHIITQGEGFESPNDGAIVTVILEGRTVPEGRVFDSRTLTFLLGEGTDVNVCEGIERALEKFTQGEKSRLVIQPKDAFGKDGNAELGVPPNSTVEYTVTLTNFEKAKDMQMMDDHEKVEEAKLFKEKGAEYFRNGKYHLALKMYKRIVNLLDTRVEYECAEQILLSAYLNLSLVYLKVSPAHHVKAREHATKALALQPDNVKALFRRGQALLGLGEAQQALDDFQKVLDAEPNNKAAVQQIALCRSTIKLQKQKEKQLYSNMFEKFAQKDREKEMQAAKDLPDVMGQKLGEWGALGGESEWTDAHRNRAPTEFEKENPNILMLDKDGQFRNM